VKNIYFKNNVFY